MMKLIVWLGNPWPNYQYNRHNIGATVLKEFLKEKEIWSLEMSHQFKGEFLLTTLLINWEMQKVGFLFPQTFMNKSWTSVSSVASFYKIKNEDILVLHDEIEYPFGKIWTKRWGSAAWHNGLRSIIDFLWTDQFPRIRIGVGKSERIPVADYVLQNFSSDEKKQFEQGLFEEIIMLIVDFLQGNLNFPEPNQSKKKKKW